MNGKTRLRRHYAKDDKSTLEKISKTVTSLAVRTEAAQSCAGSVYAYKQYRKAARESKGKN